MTSKEKEKKNPNPESIDAGRNSRKHGGLLGGGAYLEPRAAIIVGEEEEADLEDAADDAG
jgi:uncharacterized spore protein YtfJ